MNIRGLKYLDANSYEKIVVRCKDAHYFVNVLSKSHVNPNHEKHFLKRIKGLNENECLDALLTYFLDYGLINEISEVHYEPYYDDQFFKVSSRERKLLIQSDNINTIDDINAVNKKYNLNLLKTLYKDKYDYIYLEPSHKENSFKEYCCDGKKILTIRFINSLKNKNYYESILTEYIKSLLITSENYATQVRLPSYTIMIDGITIVFKKLPSNLDTLRAIIYDYNFEHSRAISSQVTFDDLEDIKSKSKHKIR